MRRLRTAFAVHAQRSRDAVRPANGAADCHPPVLGRFAPSNKRLQRTSAAASRLASAAAADRSAVSHEENETKKGETENVIPIS